MRIQAPPARAAAKFAHAREDRNRSVRDHVAEATKKNMCCTCEQSTFECSCLKRSITCATHAVVRHGPVHVWATANGFRDMRAVRRSWGGGRAGLTLNT